MNEIELQTKILEAVEEFISTPESWEEAQLTVNPALGEIDIVDIEEADELPDSIDVYDMMDLIQMTPGGDWIPDTEAIVGIAAEECK